MGGDVVRVGDMVRGDTVVGEVRNSTVVGVW